MDRPFLIHKLVLVRCVALCVRGIRRVVNADTVTHTRRKVNHEPIQTRGNIKSTLHGNVACIKAQRNHTSGTRTCTTSAPHHKPGRTEFKYHVTQFLYIMYGQVPRLRSQIILHISHSIVSTSSTISLTV